MRRPYRPVVVVLLLTGCMAKEPMGAGGRPVQMDAVTTVASTAKPQGADPIYFEFQVEQPVSALPGNGAPVYPDSLRRAGVQGMVLAQFVVDREGRPDVGTWKVLKASHEAFALAVRTALPGMRFAPARNKGAAVRQLVQQPFNFALAP